MKELTQFNWKAFDTVSGAKFAIGVVVLMLFQTSTGESWMITGLIALFAWMVNIPGPLKDRIAGMLGFALGAIFCSLLAAMLGPQLMAGIIALSVIGLLGTTAALWGTRAGMTGWAIVIYMIYAPSFVAGIGLEHTIFAIVIGVGILFVLNVAGVVIKPDGRDEPDSTGEVGVDTAYIAAYALIIALVLGVSTWLGQSIKTDPLMVTATAFFVIGFDQRKTWVGGVARLIGIALGILVGTLMVSLIGPGLFLQMLLVAACFLCFATGPVHPSLLMFFLTIYFAGGWQGMQTEALELTINEKIIGEVAGVLLAFVAIGLLRYWQGLRGVADEAHS